MFNFRWDLTDRILFLNKYILKGREKKKLDQAKKYFIMYFSLISVCRTQSFCVVFYALMSVLHSSPVH